MAERVQLGRLLVERGLLDPALLDAAIEEQQRTGRSLGQVLMAMGAIREDDLIAALAQQVGFEFVDLTSATVAPAAAAAIPDGVARELNVVGVEWRGEALVVAMADPSDGTAVERLRQVTGHDVVAVVATRTAIAAALGRAAAGTLSSPVRPADVRGGRERPAVTALLQRARDARANELLVDAEPGGGARVRLRIDGVLHDGPPLAAPVVEELRDALGELVAADGGLEVVTLPTLHGDTIVVRWRDRSEPVRGFDALGLSDDAAGVLRPLLASGHGAIVVAGPSGSGTTTTLHALLGEVASSAAHVVAVEDPIERELAGVTQVVVRPDVAVATAVRRAIESRPDALLVGELRDGATAAAALDSALAGRLVFAGILGRDAAAVPGRLLAMGLEPVLVASALRGVVGQRLLRRLCDACKAPWTPSDAELDAAGWVDALDDVPSLARPVGCDACHGIGYQGVALIAEVLLMTDDLARLIAARANQSDLHKLAVAQGMQPLRQSGLALARAGVTSLAEVVRAA